MPDKIVCYLSGNYSYAVIQKAIGEFDKNQIDSVKFVARDLISENNFDFNFGNVAGIASIIGAGLALLQITLPMFYKKTRQNESFQDGSLERTVHKAVEASSINESYRSTFAIKYKSDDCFEININIGSKIHLQTLEMVVRNDKEKNKVCVKIKDLKIG